MHQQLQRRQRLAAPANQHAERARRSLVGAANVEDQRLLALGGMHLNTGMYAHMRQDGVEGGDGDILHTRIFSHHIAERVGGYLWLFQLFHRGKV
jgi:hypothetical protein